MIRIVAMRHPIYGGVERERDGVVMMMNGRMCEVYCGRVDRVVVWVGAVGMFFGSVCAKMAENGKNGAMCEMENFHLAPGSNRTGWCPSGSTPTVP